MVKAIMHGCNGHMGRVITDIIKNTEGFGIRPDAHQTQKGSNW